MAWLDKYEVSRFRSVYNSEHPHESPIPVGSSEEVWHSLKRRLQDKCNTGSAECIISSLLRRPKAPQEWSVNRYEWLSSDDIEAIEKNYMDLFPDYFCAGVVPIDFDLKNETNQCIVSTVCAMKIDELYKQGKQQIGLVLNTDPHDGPGQHWIAVFCDIRPELEYPRMTYFDSYAEHPESEVKTLMRRWKKHWDATKVHKQGMKLTYNTTRHQYKDSECGMYCLYFHYACLMGIPMDERIPDEVINSFRNLLFKMPK
jgi:hypothetical protein